MRVSDDDLKGYSEAKTFVNTPGHDLKWMARELIAARRVVEAADAAGAWLDSGDAAEDVEVMKKAIDAYTASTEDKEDP